MTHIALQIIRDEHAALATVLRSLAVILERGPLDEPERFFDVVRAILFYIDEFPERLHHPKESDLLFPKLARAAPGLMPVIGRLESDHMKGEGRVRALQHLLLGWELIGESRRAGFLAAAREYIDFYLEHMRVEEIQILPAVEQHLSPLDWEALDAAFLSSRDPLAGGAREPCYDRLFSRIVMMTPATDGRWHMSQGLPGSQASIG
ncbi:MAG TPA: hemerythrin domain-containing protein [Ramlibacter sp.]|jgi:hemerythrin-like domain-containing protein|nr:hemerythrin domain-containing protein [Ramlibacter sp.]